MSRYSRFTLLVVAAAMLAPVSQAFAQGGYVATDRLGYTGSVTRYSTLADMQNSVNGTTFSNPQRDLSLFMIDNNANFANQWGPNPATESIFLTAWWFSPLNNGAGNPNNQNYGFLQMYDNDGATLSSMTTQWNNAGRTSFTFSASGSNSIPGCTSYPPEDCGRLYNGSTASGGSFLTYSLGLTANGLAPATFNATTGVWESVSDPTSITGYLNGTFQNTSLSDPTSNGWYSYSMTMNMTSYAYDNGYLANDPSYFGSAVTVTPEPASLGLFAMGLVGVAFVRRRKKLG
jgi:hypothetical protein